MYKNLLYEERGKVAKITFNRPSSLNALNVETKKELVEAINSSSKQPWYSMCYFDWHWR
jgi:enoyl-CoA hydratase/carnithine racemase